MGGRTTGGPSKQAAEVLFVYLGPLGQTWNPGLPEPSSKRSPVVHFPRNKISVIPTSAPKQFHQLTEEGGEKSRAYIQCKCSDLYSIKSTRRESIITLQITAAKDSTSKNICINLRYCTTEHILIHVHTAARNQLRSNWNGTQTQLTIQHQSCNRRSSLTCGSWAAIRDVHI
uniref:Uncharacterized protein n=1 Tax=Setaria italica TaxID=4555 RepID=K3YJX0_SETIT